MTIGVLFGGPTPEHDISILTGLQALRELTRSNIEVTSIYWTKNGSFVMTPSDVEAETFLRSLEVTTDDVLELLDLDLHVGIEGIEVVAGDEPGRHVPLVAARVFIRLPDVIGRRVIGAEPALVEIGVFVIDGGVGIEPQRLMIADRPRHFLVDIGLDKLRAIIAVVGADVADDGDIMQQAGEHQLFRQAVAARERRALQQMAAAALVEQHALLEEVDERRRRRHGRQARLLVHEAATRRAARSTRRQLRDTPEKWRRDRAIKQLHHGEFEQLVALGVAHVGRRLFGGDPARLGGELLLRHHGERLPCLRRASGRRRARDS